MDFVYTFNPEFLIFFARIVVGFTMLHYGLPKVLDLTENAIEFSDMGFKPGMFWGTLVALVECFGGIAVLLGFYVDFFAALYAFQCMTSFFWKLKTEAEFFDYSYDLHLFALCIFVIGWGPGLWALTESSGFVFLRWNVAITTAVIAWSIAFMPEIFGKRYKKWRA